MRRNWLYYIIADIHIKQLNLRRTNNMSKAKTLAKKGARLLGETGIFFSLTAGSVLAQSGIQEGANDAQPTGTPTELFGEDGLFKVLANTLIFIIGAIAVIMLIVGGIRYVVSGGNDQAVQGAKNTILYAIIGIAVAFLAYAAVNFVIGQLGTVS